MYLRRANLIMALLFLLSVIVQFNDPDPLQWIALYGLASVSCCLSYFGRLPRLAPLALGLLSFAWAGLLRKEPTLDFFASFEMVNLAVEQAREMFGLMLTGLWMTVLTIFSGRPVRKSTT